MYNNKNISKFTIEHTTHTHYIHRKVPHVENTARSRETLKVSSLIASLFITAFEPLEAREKKP